MTRTSNVGKNGLRKGPWSKEEDNKLRAYVERYGHWNWRELPRFAGVSRCGKSCRLRWMNYLRPNIKHGSFTKKEEDLIMEIHNKIGNKWAKIAAELPGRSDNEIKNHWHTHLKKRPENNQNNSKNMHYEIKNQTNFISNLVVSSDLGDIDKAEGLWKSSSSSELFFASTHEYAYVAPPPPLPPSAAASSSFSSSVESTSSMLMASDSLISSGDTLQTYTDEYDDGNFWTDLFLPDLEDVDMNAIMAPGDSEDFTWSTMDLYWQYHS